MMRRLVHFFAIGAVLAVGRLTIPASAPDEAHVIAVTSEVAQRLAAVGGTTPDRALAGAPFEQWLDDEVLYREGMRRGLSRNPASIARRLQVGRFVGPDGSDEDALADVDRLGLGANDPVVRAQVVAWMRLRLQSESMREPSDHELGRYLAEHVERFTPPARVTFAHVFVRRERDLEGRGAAVAVADRIRREAPAVRQAVALGDLFRDGDRFVSYSPHDVASMFGPAVAEVAATHPERQWSAPVRSPYGWHLLWVETRSRPQPPALDAVRERVRQAWRLDFARQAVGERVRTLRAAYRVDVAPAARGDG